MSLIDAEKLKREVKEHCKKLIDEGVKEVDVVDIAAEIVKLVDAQTEFAENESEHTRQWISVRDRLPENEQEVFVCCNRGGYRFCCPAIYEDGSVLTQDSAWNWYELYNYGTYSGENDDYFVPKGWWENRHFTPDDVYNCPVDCEVTHWMPLPELPEEVAQ